MLDHFPELFQVVTFWEMDKVSNGSYGPRANIRHIPVITLNDMGDRIKRKKTVDSWVLDASGNDVIYAYDDADISVGSFLIHPYTQEWNRVREKLSYSSTGGFNIWGIERVQGTDYQDPQTLLPPGGMF